MHKIDTIFERDETQSGHPVIDRVKPQCQWVLDGEGIATLKMDGTNVKVENGQLFKRQKPPERDYDDASYIPCDRSNPQDKWHWRAWDSLTKPLADGIYELIGEHIQGNPNEIKGWIFYRVVPIEESLTFHEANSINRSFEGFRQFFEANPGYEGIVFHHSDGRMAKIKARDFRLPWPPK